MQGVERIDKYISASVSGVPSRPARATHADNSAMKASFIQRGRFCHFAFAPSMIGVLWMRVNDFTMFAVTALYFLKCGVSRCDL